jgi:pimeloyl-ACP methyl ester carboxylesterase
LLAWTLPLLMTASTAIAPRQHRVPGSLIVESPLSLYVNAGRSIPLADGRILHIVCMGKGSPTVILNAGAGDWSAIWSKVQPTVASHTRVCAWDRAGYGFSGASSKVQTVDNTTADLAEALAAGGIAGPYILVGHSMGSYEALLFADRFRSRVKGMVLIDPSIPDQAAIFLRAAPAFSAYSAQATREEAKRLLDCALSARASTKLPGTTCRQYPGDYPASLSAALSRLDAMPDRAKTAASLQANFAASAALAQNSQRTYGAMPLTVLTAGAKVVLPNEAPAAAKREIPALEAEWVRGHEAMAALSTRGSNRLVRGSAHYIQLEKPKVVIAAIVQMIETVRQPSLR